MDVQRIPHGTADCARETPNHVPALALLRVDGEPPCLPHFLVALRESED